MPPSTRGESPSCSKASGNGPVGSAGCSGGGPAGGSGWRGPRDSSGSRSRGGRLSRPPRAPPRPPRSPRSGRAGRSPRSGRGPAPSRGGRSAHGSRGPRSSRGGRGGRASRGGRSSAGAAVSESVAAGRGRSGRASPGWLGRRSSLPGAPLRRSRPPRLRRSPASRPGRSEGSKVSSGKRSFLERAGWLGLAGAEEVGAGSPIKRFRPELKRPRRDFFGGLESDGFFTGCNGPGLSWSRSAAPEHGRQQGHLPAEKQHDRMTA